ncbi:hypothetical protein BJ875DRAFT_476478 [Amylocarpus encephaloides]|uniref:AAA+ ATPase domain-containing protein n=1 Tax=Amylocarpus encephaloides TaxID=45428 RepID=A0A9P8C173_9HELO|nr:hypothetical protein BJ875DRAFT_476478 [Amylocarpus encephaloides]
MSPEEHGTGDKYVSLLEKVGSMEKELNMLRNPESKEDNSAKPGVGVIDTTKDDNELLKMQKVEIMRVPADKWRDVKKEGKIDPRLSVLIVSSKKTFKRQNKGSTSKSQAAPASETKSHEESSKFSTVETPYRLAINSAYLLHVLGQCTATNFEDDHNVFVRPFKYLVSYESEIREFLQDVEAELEQLEAKLKSPAREGCDDADNEESCVAEEVRQAKRNSDELCLLIQFMDTDMQDIFDIKKKIKGGAIQEIAFEHLWQLYTPGTTVYFQEQPEEIDRFQAHRVLHVTGGRACFDWRSKNDSERGVVFDPLTDRNWDAESEDEMRCRDTVTFSTTETTSLIVDCYSLDFDGYRVGPRSKRVGIVPYIGKRQIHQLPVYPSKYHSLNEKIKESLIRRGRRFTELVFGSHKTYSGVSIREAKQLNNRWFSYVIPDIEVKSEVMIDQASGAENFKKKHLFWEIKIGGGIVTNPTQADVRETFDLLPRKKEDPWVTDVFDDSAYEIGCRTEFLRSTVELRLRTLKDLSLPDESLELLPLRVYGYAMLHHRWLSLDINLVEDIKQEEVEIMKSSFDNLVLPHGHRKLIQALIKNQVRGIQSATSGPGGQDEEFSMDLVKEKGKGLIILLHGVPGVGKTSTAECVAAHLGRPLLPITCGEIGTNAKEAEETLEGFCDLAYRWRCVLLLDEADVFLAKREKGDIVRNSLVSVFLRVLDYYSGVIILTTNRVGEFDEAFRSRIHISLYYPKLDRLSTKNVWENNIARVKNGDLDIDIEEGKIRRFYERHWEENIPYPSRAWNGRQIKNAFQTALALANWDFHDAESTPRLERPFLKAAHFVQVAETSAHFDDYISDVHGMGEMDTFGTLAEREETRKDAYLGVTPKSRGQEDRRPRRGPVSTRRAPGYRTAYGSFGDSDVDDNEGEERVRRTPVARRGGISRRYGGYNYGSDAMVDEEEDENIGRRKKEADVSHRGTGRTAGSTKYNQDELSEDDLNDIERLERELEVKKLKKRRGLS